MLAAGGDSPERILSPRLCFGNPGGALRGEGGREGRRSSSLSSALQCAELRMGTGQSAA